MEIDFRFELLRTDVDSKGELRYRWYSPERQLWSTPTSRDEMMYVLTTVFHVTDRSIRDTVDCQKRILQSDKIEKWVPNTNPIVMVEGRKVYDIKTGKVSNTDINLMLDFYLKASPSAKIDDARLYLFSLTDDYIKLKECLGYMLIPNASKVYSWTGTDGGRTTLLEVIKYIFGYNMRNVGNMECFLPAKVCYTSEIIKHVAPNTLDNVSVFIMDIEHEYPSDGELQCTPIRFRKLVDRNPNMLKYVFSIKNQIFQIMIDSARAIIHQ
jgi:hypothetical protein